MTLQERIVRPRPQWKTRRLVCRPKARFCAKLALCLVGAATVIYPAVLCIERGRSVLQVLSVILGGLALMVGAVGLFFRITETQREVTIRERQDRGDPPVIYLEPKS
jgi:hypothetical protein